MLDLAHLLGCNLPALGSVEFSCTSRLRVMYTYFLKRCS